MVKEIPSDEELLKLAKEKYIRGVVFLNIYSPHFERFIVEKESYEIHINKIDNSKRVWVICNKTDAKNNFASIYDSSHNGWAEIISTPIIEQFPIY